MDDNVLIEVLKDAEAMYRRWAEMSGPPSGQIDAPNRGFDEKGFYRNIGKSMSQYTRTECLNRADFCKRRIRELEGACV